ncbi:MAG: hypothetical protein HY400_03615 [Elusimicrobia bacterium]|nr:hypothetical protein [Elusimicrobiota bacterium]
MNIANMSNPAVQMVRLLYVICQNKTRLMEKSYPHSPQAFYVWGKKSLRFIKKP